MTSPMSSTDSIETAEQPLPPSPRRGWDALRGKRGPQIVLFAFLLVSMAGLTASVQYWLVTLHVASGEAIPQLGRALAVLPESWLSYWKWASKDASTVTSLVSLLFFFSMTSASLAFFRPARVLQARADRRRDRFPFPSDFQTTWVQLGLIGTLWGFLLIGNQMEIKQDPTQNVAVLVDPAQSVTILVLAFGTALLSTLAGVVAAYLLAPPVCTAYAWLLKEAGAGPQKSVGLLDDLKVRLRDLGNSATVVSRTLDPGNDEEMNLRKSAANASEALQELRERIAGIDLEAQLKQIVEAVVKRVGETQADRIRQSEDSLNRSLVLVATKIGEGLVELGRELRDAHLAAVAQIQEGMAGVRAQQTQAQAEARDSLAVLSATLAEEQRRLEVMGTRVEGQIQELATSLKDLAQVRLRTIAMRRQMIAVQRSVRKILRHRPPGSAMTGRRTRLARWLATLRNFFP